MSHSTSVIDFNGLTDETNAAWRQFLSCLRRDCGNEEPQRADSLLQETLQLISEQISAINPVRNGGAVFKSSSTKVAQTLSSSSRSSGSELEQMSQVELKNPPNDIASAGSVAISSSSTWKSVQNFVISPGLPYEKPGNRVSGQANLFHHDGDLQTASTTLRKPFIKSISEPISEQPTPNVLLSAPGKRRYSGEGDNSDTKIPPIFPEDDSSLNGNVKRHKLSLSKNFSPRSQHGKKDLEGSIEKLSFVNSGHPIRYLNSQDDGPIPRPIPLIKDEEVNDGLHEDWEALGTVNQPKTETLTKTEEISLTRFDQPEEQPVTIFRQFVPPDVFGSATKKQEFSAQEALSVVSFVTAVASSESLIEFKQAVVGWRTQSTTMDLIQANSFVSALKALNQLEAHSAFNSLATRVKLVHLAEAVDTAHRTLPRPKGRGNPIVKWTSEQYKLFLSSEYPYMEEKSRPWNNKLEQLKKKVKVGRRWQQLVKSFGVGIIALVPSSGSAGDQIHDFNLNMKTYSDPCFKSIIETLEIQKGDYIRALGAKLEVSVVNLFKGNPNPPILVLESIDSSQIAAQPNLSPAFGKYLDVDTRDHSSSSTPKHTKLQESCYPQLDPLDLTGKVNFTSIDLTTVDESTPVLHLDPIGTVLQRLGMSNANLDEFKPRMMMSGATVNAFMRLLQEYSDMIGDQSLFLGPDFLPGMNKCLYCRANELDCDRIGQDGKHCSQCRSDGVICEEPKENSRINAGNFYQYKRIFMPAFSKAFNHWSLVLVSNKPENSVRHYDSLDSASATHARVLSQPFHEAVKWVKEILSPTVWESEGWSEQAELVAKQPPGDNDCGICLVLFSRLLLKRQPLPRQGMMSPALMRNLRSSFQEEILDGRFNEKFHC